MLKRIVIAIVVVFVGLAGFIASRPSSYAVERQATIAAPPDVVWEQVNDFHKWDAWSPWAKLDPSMKTRYSGAEAGQGAMYWWGGNDKVGEGQMTIEETQSAQKVAIKLEFLKPWQATNQTDFAFAADGGGTKVTWSMKGTNDFMGKAFSLFMDMDEMIGKDFENGLASMKTVAEAEAARRQAEAEAAAQAAAAAPADPNAEPAPGTPAAGAAADTTATKTQ